jgi:serine/threonine protein kinase
MLGHIECDDYHYLVFEYVKATDMFTFLERRRFQPLPEHEARFVSNLIISQAYRALILQVFRALEHIHANSIAHRDVKLENILVSENNHVTLIDFGLCSFIEEGKLCREWCGSDNYLVVSNEQFS